MQLAGATTYAPLMGNWRALLRDVRRGGRRLPLAEHTEAIFGAVFLNALATLGALVIASSPTIWIGAKWLSVVCLLIFFVFLGPLFWQIASRHPAKPYPSFPPPPSPKWKQYARRQGQAAALLCVMAGVVLWLAYLAAMTFVVIVVIGFTDEWAAMSSLQTTASSGPAGLDDWGLALVFGPLPLCLALTSAFAKGEYRTAQASYLEAINNMVSPGLSKIAALRKTLADVGPAMKSMEKLSLEISGLQVDLERDLKSKQAEFYDQLQRLAANETAIQTSEAERDAVFAVWEAKHQAERRRDRWLDITESVVIAVISGGAGFFVSQVWGK